MSSLSSAANAGSAFALSYSTATSSTAATSASGMNFPPYAPKYPSALGIRPSGSGMKKSDDISTCSSAWHGWMRGFTVLRRERGAAPAGGRAVRVVRFRREGGGGCDGRGSLYCADPVRHRMPLTWPGSSPITYRTHAAVHAARGGATAAGAAAARQRRVRVPAGGRGGAQARPDTGRGTLCGHG